MCLFGLNMTRPGRLGPVGGTDFDYYIDSVAGSDSNAGTSASASWATLGKLTSASALRNNVRIGLKRGGFWREFLDVNSYTGVYVGAYGAGPMPEICGADVASSDGWALTGGRTKAYNRPWANSITLGFIQLWEDDVAMMWVSSEATCESTPGSFYVSNTLANPATIYYHPTGSGNPASNGKVVEITRWDGGLHGAYFTPGALTAVGICCSKPGHNNGALVASTAIDCLAVDGLKHNLGSPDARRCVAWRAASGAGRTGQSLWVGFAADGTGVTIRAEQIYCVDGPTADAFLSHTSNPAKPTTAVNLTNVYAYNCAQGAACSDSLALNVDGAFFERVAIGIGPNNSIGVNNLSNITFIPTSADGSAPGTTYNRAVNNSVTAAVVTIRDLRCYLEGEATAGFIVAQGYASLDVQYSTFVGSGAGAHVAIYSALPLSGGIISKHNVATGCDTFYQLYGTATVSESDYNVMHFGSAAIDNTILNTNYTTFAAYRSAYPAFDANTSTSDPLLAGDPQLGDFSLSSGTPADTGGRAAGSRKTIARPDWDALRTLWSTPGARYLGIDGTGP